MSERLAKAQIAGLAYIALNGARGPAPGWNALVWIEGVCEGEDLAALFAGGLITAEPADPPHFEESDEDSGSITCDHFYRVTDAGRALLSLKDNANG